jgi:excinuclease ABC subunit C
LTLPARLSEKLRRIPPSPGVYFFKDSSGKILYVGKARKLSSRVASYFSRAQTPHRIRLLVRKIADIDYLVFENDLEALLAENNFIKEHSPPYNIRLKDDKSYPYVRVSLEEELPRVFLTRSIDEKRSRYFGPYTDLGSLKATLRILKSLFPIRDCPGDVRFQSLDRECLYYHIDRCKAPCTGRQSVDHYRADVDRVILCLSGKVEHLIEETRGKMESSSEELRYEEAARHRDTLDGLEKMRRHQRAEIYGGGDRDAIAMARDGRESCLVLMRIRSGKLMASETFTFRNSLEESDDEVLLAFLKQFYDRVLQCPGEILIPHHLEEAPLLESWLELRFEQRVKVRVPLRGLGKSLLLMAEDNARTKLDELLMTGPGRAGKVPPEIFELRDVLQIPFLPRLIDGIDISNTGDVELVASLVRYRDGVPQRSQYRHFRIRTGTGQDDFASIREVVLRRYRALKERKEDFPDLLLIDGGKGQLSSAFSALEELEVEGQTLISLAKKEETVYQAERPESPLILPPSSAALKLLQQVRNESHRFAVEFHRKRRGKRSLSSELDSIPGLGPARRDALLKHFKDLRRIRAAALDELMQVPGFGEALARQVIESLKEGNET